MTRVPPPGLRLIKQFEGCHLEAYPDPLTRAEPYTIGWGSTRRKDGTPFRLGDTLTEAEAEDLLLWQIERNFLPALERIPTWVRFNDDQAGAVLSFAYNLGAGFYGSNGFETITRVLRESQWEALERAFTLYRNPGSNVEEGLLRRRLSEAAVFMAGTPGTKLSAVGETYLATTTRTYRQNPLLSDQAIQYLAFLRGEAVPLSVDKSQGARILLLTDPPLQGEDVRDVQKALARSGAGIVIDGVFGSGTDLAVKRFQQVNGLVADGVVGPATRSRLFQRVLYLTDPPMTGEDVKTVQQSLRAKGFAVTIDGVFGLGTKQAVETFQRKVGLLVDGVVGPQTLKILSVRTLYLTYPNFQGEDVKAVQRALTRAGLSVIVDGFFGAGTEWAVKQFQVMNNILADGVVGPQTLVKLRA